MARSSVVTRCAEREDAALLAELWSDVLRRADRTEQAADLELVIKQAAATPDERFVVAECNGEVAGAVLLRLATLSPINLEPCVQTIHPRVLPAFRRRGVGRALMEAATIFAEENGVLLVSTVVPSQARDANRFMARLGLVPGATWRVAPTTVVRSRLTPTRAGASRARVMAARRTARRSARREDRTGDA